MTCPEALRLLLEVDPDELSGRKGQDDDLAYHLRQCARCQAAADLILGTAGVLREDLAASGPNPVDVARRARIEAGRRRHRRRRLWQAGPLAAAALLAGILVTRHGPSEPGLSLPVAPAARSRGVTVTAPPGRNVAVLNSDSSDLVVIWFF